MDHEEYLRRVKSYIKTPTKDMEKMLEDFCKLCTYVSGQYDKDESFLNLNKHLEDLEKGRKEAHRLFYMALPPSVFTIVSQHLKRCCYPTKGIARVIVCPPPLPVARTHGTFCADQSCVDVLGRETIRQGPCKLPRATEVFGTGLEGG